MNSFDIPLSDTGLYGSLMMDYVEGHPQLRSFYRFTPSHNSMVDVIESRRKFPFHRDVVADELKLQHEEYFSRFPNLQPQIQALRSENTFTVTTGHQLCLGTGPLFFIYKIISAINLCRELKKTFPAYNFIPVYWMASEDHDTDEINHLHLFGKRLKWDTHQRGCSGRLKTEGLGALIADIENLCGTASHTAEVTSLLSRSYLSKDNLSDATRELVLSLFAKEDLLVLDADRASLKKLFAAVIREELSLSPSFEIVNHTTASLARLYKTQLTPREINLFYIDDELRERIVRDEDGHYMVVNTDLRFKHDFILDLVDRFPERFSPNVVLRPLYQECILPNLAYIGGPGEISYWMQLKDLFEHYNISYPMLVPRNNAVIVPVRQMDKFTKMGFGLKDVFRPYDDLSKQWVGLQGDLFGELASARIKVQETYQSLAQLFTATDPTLTASVQAEMQKVLNGLDQLEKKGNAALKRKNEILLSQLRSFLDKVNPDNQPQERTANFLQFYAFHGPAFIEELLNKLQPLSNNLTLFTE